MPQKRKIDSLKEKENIPPQSTEPVTQLKKKYKKKKLDGPWSKNVDGRVRGKNTHSSFSMGINMSYEYKNAENKSEMIKFYFLLSKDMLSKYQLDEDKLKKRIQEKLTTKLEANVVYNQKNEEAILAGKKNKKEFTPRKIRSLDEFFTDKPLEILASPGGTEYKPINTGIESGIIIYCNVDINPELVANREAMQKNKEEITTIQQSDQFKSIVQPVSSDKHTNTLITKKGLESAKKKRNKNPVRDSYEQKKAMAIEAKDYAKISATAYLQEVGIFSKKVAAHFDHQEAKFVNNNTSPTKLSVITERANWNKYNNGESFIHFLKEKYPDGFIYDSETTTLPFLEMDNENNTVSEHYTHIGDKINLTFMTPDNPPLHISFDALYTGELHHATQQIHQLVYHSIIELWEENKAKKELTTKIPSKTQKNLLDLFDQQVDQSDSLFTAKKLKG